MLAVALGVLILLFHPKALCANRNAGGSWIILPNINDCRLNHIF